MKRIILILFSGLFFLFNSHAQFSLFGYTSFDSCSTPACDGQIQTYTNGGFSPYNYQWSTGETVSNLTGLCKGLYFCEVTDFVGQEASNWFYVAGDSVNGWVYTDDDIANACVGTAYHSFFSDTAGWSFYWPTTLQTGLLATGLCAGYDSMYAYNACDDTTWYYYNIANTCVLSLTSNVTGNSCSGGCDGAINVTVTGGAGAYSYNWNDTTTTQNRSGLCGGTYSLNVYNTEGCSFDTTFEIINASGLTAQYNTDTSYCISGNLLNLDILGLGGNTPYNYYWQHDTLPYSGTTQGGTGIPAGTYSLTVTDAANCTSTMSFYWNSYNWNYINSSSSTGTCYDGVGSIQVYTDAQNVLYSVDSGSTWQASSTFNSLPYGTYYAAVQDTNGCELHKWGASELIDCKPNYIHGNVYKDFNANCIRETGEPGLESYIIVVNPGFMYYYVDTLGSFSFLLDSGDYTVSFLYGSILDSLVSVKACPSSGQ